MADAERPDSLRKRSRGFVRASGGTFAEAVEGASTEDRVRGFVAFVLVLVLLALVLVPPDGKEELVASAKTLAIAVIAFYFGLHKATPHRKVDGKSPPTDPSPRVVV